MNLVPWKRRSEQSNIGPIELMRAFENRLDRLFGNGLFELGDDWFEGRSPIGPAVDISDEGKEIMVAIDAPGMKPEDFDIQITGDILTVSGKMSHEKEEGDKERGWYRRERRHGTFQRSIRLPAPIESDKIAAEYNNGVLTIRCAKPKEIQPKRIEVKG